MNFFFFLLKVLEVDLIYFHYVHVAWKIFPSKLQKSGHTVEHELYIPHFFFFFHRGAERAQTDARSSLCAWARGSEAGEGG